MPANLTRLRSQNRCQFLISGTILFLITIAPTAEPLQAARLEFANADNVTGTARLSNTMKGNYVYLRSSYYDDLVNVTTPSSSLSLAGASSELLFSKYESRYAAMRLCTRTNADRSYSLAEARISTTYDVPGGGADFIAIKILPTYGENNGKPVRVTFRVSYFRAVTSTGKGWTYVEASYAAPGNNSYTVMTGLDNLKTSPLSVSRSVSFNTTIGSTFYIRASLQSRSETIEGRTAMLKLDLEVQ